MRIIKAIRYEPAIIESEERDRIRFILTCSNGLILNAQEIILKETGHSENNDSTK